MISGSKTEGKILLRLNSVASPRPFQEATPAYIKEKFEKSTNWFVFPFSLYYKTKESLWTQHNSVVT